MVAQRRVLYSKRILGWNFFGPIARLVGRPDPLENLQSRRDRSADMRDFRRRNDGKWHDIADTQPNFKPNGKPNAAAHITANTRADQSDAAAYPRANC